MSHPEYVCCCSGVLFKLKSILDTGEFEIPAPANCIVFPNKTNANQLSARVLILLPNNGGVILLGCGEPAS